MPTLFTGWQYMLIDLANAFGLDKDLFEDRIHWAETNLPHLEQLVDQADSKPLFFKAMLAIRAVQRGEPVHHVVGLDACCSGIQVMSALTGCITGATNTGLVDPNVRADAYGTLQKVMENVLNGQVHVERGDSKQALMTMMYGSKKEPINVFGADTEELTAFYESSQIIAPGAYELLQDLLASWRPYALEHSWQLPDGFQAKVKVMEKKEARIEVDELDHATFTYEFYENVGTKKGLSNAANVVHSVDAYVLRCIHRRCNYNRELVEQAKVVIDLELEARADNAAPILQPKDKLLYYVEQYNRSGMADVVILPYITMGTGGTAHLTTEHLQKMQALVDSMLVHKPFPVITIHDEFKCGPNHMNHLRQHYINIFAELAESNLLSDILSQIHGVQGTFTKLSNTLPQLIRGSNYALS
ncbi:MAG TPA: DNA-directed RNA polymerase [Candidatus Acidoferrum sp.]|nr:DNA-directed RNA polymerase [Candidatus Acidoferrum sp.]